MNKNMNIHFESYGNNEYVFDSDTSIIFEKNNYEKRLKKINEIKKTKVEQNTEYDSRYIEEYILRFGLGQMIMEVTNSCNFRCKYCVFSEYYKGHSTLQNENMTFETAKQAIDKYIELLNKGATYNPERIPIIGFYGGEPLINFELIKECVKYAKKRYNGEMKFSITTNAYLLTDEISRFFAANDFMPIFSLDGPENIHDANRKLIGGKGTFNRVYQNIRRYAHLSDSIALVNSVYDYNTDLEELMEFWANQNEMVLLSLSPVNPYDTDYYRQFDEKTVKAFFEKKNKLEKYFLELIAKKDDLTSKEKREKNFLNVLVGKPAASVYMKDVSLYNIRNIVKCTGSCVPGDKIFVNVKGAMYPCEKVDQSMIIGDINRGLDYSCICKYMKDFEEKITSSCSNCNVRNVCSMCYQSFHSKNGFCKNNWDCNNMRQNYKELLIRAVSLSEIDPGWFCDFTTEYYKKIKELAVVMK